MKILFVVTAFYPEQAIGAVRITKFAKFLERAGYDVSVISLAPAPWATKDESLWFPALDNIRWLVVPQGKVFNRLFLRARTAAIGDRPAVHAMESDAKLGLGRIVRWAKSKGQLAYTLVKALDWMVQVRRTAKAELRQERFDVIFTSYPSLASPFSGLMLKRMGLGEVAVIDFRDPLSYGTTSTYSVSRCLERWLLDRADVTSYSSKGVQSKIQSHKSDVGGFVGKVITNGFDPDDRCVATKLDIPRVDPAIMRFTYVGSLYGGKRDLSPFFRALNQLLMEEEFSASVIELHYAGQEGRVFLSQAAAYGLGDYVIDHGRVSRMQSLRLQEEADVCLLVTWNTKADQGIISGKLFEFFLLKKPVLGIVNGDKAQSEVKSIIQEVNAGFCFEEAHPADAAAMREWMVSAIREKSMSGAVTQDYTRSIDNYDIEALVLGLFSDIGRDSVLADHLR